MHKLHKHQCREKLGPLCTAASGPIWSKNGPAWDESYRICQVDCINFGSTDLSSALTWVALGCPDRALQSGVMMIY